MAKKPVHGVGVGGEVPPTQPPRLLSAAIGPFQSAALHPLRSSRSISGQKRVQATAGLDPADAPQLVPVLDGPEFLAGFAKRDAEDIRSAVPDLFAYRIVLRWGEVTVAAADDLDAGICGLDGLNRRTVLCLSCPQHVEAQTMGLGCLSGIVEEVRGCDSLGEGATGQLAREDHGHTIRVHYVSLCHGLGKSWILACQRDTLTV